MEKSCLSFRFYRFFDWIAAILLFPLLAIAQPPPTGLPHLGPPQISSIAPPVCPVPEPQAPLLTRVGHRAIRRLIEMAGLEQASGFATPAANALLAHVSRLPQVQKAQRIADIASTAFQFLDNVGNMEQGQVLPFLGELAAQLPSGPLKEQLIQRMLTVVQRAGLNPQLQQAIEGRAFHPGVHSFEGAVAGLATVLPTLAQGEQRRLLGQIQSSRVGHEIEQRYMHFFVGAARTEQQLNQILAGPNNWLRRGYYQTAVQAQEHPERYLSFLATLGRFEPHWVQNAVRNEAGLRGIVSNFLREHSPDTQRTTVLQRSVQVAGLVADVVNLVDPSPTCGAIRAGLCVADELLLPQTERNQLRLALGVVTLLPYVSKVASAHRVGQQVIRNMETARNLLNRAYQLQELTDRLSTQQGSLRDLQTLASIVGVRTPRVFPRGFDLNRQIPTDLPSLASLGNDLLEQSAVRRQWFSGGAVGDVLRSQQSLNDHPQMQQLLACGTDASLEQYANVLYQSHRDLRDHQQGSGLFQNVLRRIMPRPRPPVFRGAFPEEDEGDLRTAAAQAFVDMGAVP